MNEVEKGPGWMGEVAECRQCGKQFRRYNRQRLFCDNCMAQQDSKVRQQKKSADTAPKPKGKAKDEYTLAEWNAAARKYNLSYGKYSEAVKAGYLPPPERAGAAKRSRKK